MAVNDKIRTSDYNTMQSTLANVLGGGSGTSGWGQTVRSSQVAVGNKVTINEWGNLRYDIINAYKHINGSTPTTAQAVEGEKIKYRSSFTPDTGTLDAPYTQYDTYINSIVANKFTVGTGQYATTSATTSSTTWPNATYGSYWTSKIACLVTVEWQSADQARYFFNSGGLIRIAASRTGGSSSPQNNSWSSILSTAGTREFGAVVPNTGTTPADCTNWYRLTNTYNPWYSINGSSPYGSNQYRISARCPNVNNSTGTATSAEFYLEFFDNYTDPGQHPSNPVPDYIDAIDGTFTVSVSLKYATGIMVPSGTFAVTNPTVTVGAVAP